jgi:hypothetical protein
VGGTSSAPASSKSKEKQAWVIADDDEVSSNEGLLLQRRLRLHRSVTSMAGRTPSTGRRASEEVITSVPDPLTMVSSMVVPGGSSSGVSMMVDSAVAVKTVDDVSVVRKPT